MDVQVGDVIRMKKPHPCGSLEFTVLRVGMDFKIKCNGCGREVMIPGSNVKRTSRRSSVRRGNSSGFSKEDSIFGKAVSCCV